ncbi:hypothetical protein OG21DRAFT_1484750 [Imleria badia]|nr:hypothetical protein OG21DRAFT_1484750 [Imleria badia]
MRITIEDLEAVKELNDELKENHMETEKALQEIDSKDTQIREHLEKVSTLEHTCQDLENTITQFRELVLQLQSELDKLLSQTQTTQHESATAAFQTAVMMSLNLKLRSSAAKNQARTVELEVYEFPESLNGDVSETVVGICEMRGRAAALAILCKRFAAILRRCGPTSFLNIGHIHPEIAPMEKRIKMYIDLRRRDEFREMEFVNNIVKLQAQFDHLTETYFSVNENWEMRPQLTMILACAPLRSVLRKPRSLLLCVAKTWFSTWADTIQNPNFLSLFRIHGQCKSAKDLSKKLTKRVEDVIQDPAALKACPTFADPVRPPPTPLLDPPTLSELDSETLESDLPPSPPPTIRALAMETKMLYRDVIKFSSPRVVDLSALHAKRSEGETRG